ncbi:MAG: hypothetical protein L0099_00270 [Acidobacteria bacterium]|nr:hypothetical protein [Acidobacteriota bacterium]
MAIAVLPAFGEGTRTWQQSKLEEFSKGTAYGVAMGSDGSLTPAPPFQALATTPSSYLWDIAADGQGNVYAAAGSPARVYRIAADGKVTVIFRPQELQVQALAVDQKGILYAATSPDGKVYKIERGKAAAGAPPPAEKKVAEKASAKDKKSSDPGGTSAAELQPEAPVDPEYSSSVFFEPKTKYIWDLLLDATGRMYVATGDQGEIFRVEPDGKGAVFFKSDEAHIRSLALDRSGNLIAGSDGSGLVYRLSPAGEAFVVFSASKREITALAADAHGNLYAAGLGEKRTGATPAPPLPVAPLAGPPVSAAQPGSIAVTLTATPPAPPPPSTGTSPVPGGSEVYRIAVDGSPRTLWSSREHLVYALAFDSGGRLLAGTGNQGRVFALAANGDYADLLKASANQVTAFATPPDGGFFAATGNLGKVFRMGAATKTSAEARFESDVFDAKVFSRWGRLETRGSGDYEVFVRSGNVDNPDRNWSPWKKVDIAKGGAIETPPARFLQWKTVLSSGPRPGRVEGVVVSYRPKNVAPKVDEVVVLVGARFPPVVKPQQEQPVNIPVGQTPQNPQPPRFDPTPSAVRDRGWVAARWSAKDENDDDLTCSVYYRGDGEKNWKLLKDKIDGKFYSWETGLLPDGGYTVKVMASDASSNPAEDALSDEKESAHFEVDATPPRIENLAAVAQSTKARVSFRASDSYSPIQRAEYSLDAGDWQRVEPAGEIADSANESYDFTVPLPSGGGEHVVVVRVYDRFENMGAAKAVVK